MLKGLKRVLIIYIENWVSLILIWYWKYRLCLFKKKYLCDVDIYFDLFFGKFMGCYLVIFYKI